MYLYQCRAIEGSKVIYTIFLILMHSSLFFFIRSPGEEITYLNFHCKGNNLYLKSDRVILLLLLFDGVDRRNFCSTKELLIFPYQLNFCVELGSVNATQYIIRDISRIQILTWYTTK